MKFISKSFRNKLGKVENEILDKLIEKHQNEICSCSIGKMCPIALYHDSCSEKDLIDFIETQK